MVQVWVIIVKDGDSMPSQKELKPKKLLTNSEASEGCVVINSFISHCNILIIDQFTIKYQVETLLN